MKTDNIPLLPKTTLRCSVLGVALSLFTFQYDAAAQEIDPKILYRVEGDDAGDRFGVGVYALGDIDLDGITDFGATTGNTTENSYLRVFSGGDGRELYTIWNDAPGSWIGTQDNCTTIGDIDGDSIPDFIVGNKKFGDSQNGQNDGGVGARGTGRALVYSGANGAIIRSHIGREINSSLVSFGQRIEPLGDIDQDGHTDYAIGNGPFNDRWSSSSAPGIESHRFEIHIFSGRTGDEIAAIEPSSRTNPTAFVGLDDLNGDNVPDLAVMAAYPSDDYDPKIHFLSGAIRGAISLDTLDEELLLHTHTPPSQLPFNDPVWDDYNWNIHVSENHVSYQFLWTVSDLDGDGLRDVLYTSSAFDSIRGGPAILNTISSKTGEMLWKAGLPTPPFWSRIQSATGLGDIDNGGISDIMAGGKIDQIYIHSGETGERLHTINGWNENYGDYVVQLSDLSGDGISEIAISDRDQGSGRVDIYSFGPQSILRIPDNYVPSLTVLIEGDDYVVAWPAVLESPIVETSVDLNNWKALFATAPKNNRYKIPKPADKQAQYFRLRYSLSDVLQE